MKKQQLILITGVISGLAAIFMVNVYLNQQRRAAEEIAQRKYETTQANQAAVLVAKEDIAKGSVLKPESLKVEIIPNQFVQPQAVTSSDRVAGMITITSISKGEQITLNKLMSAKEVTTGGSLAMSTPIGKRAITISVDNIISAVAGLIRPGDYVDVIAMVPVPVQTADGKQVTQVAVMPLFQNVLVLAVGQEAGVQPPTSAEMGRYGREEQAAGPSSLLITLALNPQEANLIAFVQEQGRIRLTLRSPADSQVTPVQPASWDTLFQYVMPREAIEAKQGPEKKTSEPEPVTYVDIYRGLSKEKIPLSK